MRQAPAADERAGSIPPRGPGKPSFLKSVFAVDQAYNMIRFIADHEGIYISPSGAANLLGAVDVASRVKDAEIVTTLADTLERYKEVHKEIFKI